jgi:hypothetical protein
LAYVPMQIILWLRNTNKFSGAIVFILQGDRSSFLRFHGAVRLAHVRDRARAPAKSSYSSAFLLCSCRSCFPCPGGGICRGVLGVLQVMIWFTSALIPLLTATVLWLGAASSDSFGDLAYCGLHNLVRGLCNNKQNYVVKTVNDIR